MLSSIFRGACFIATGFLVSVGIGVNIAAPLAAQTASSSLPVSRITEPIDESRRAVLPGNIHPLAIAAYDQGEASLSTPTGRIQLVLRRSPGQQRALVQYLSDVQNPHSASYHKWLTPVQFGAEYGVTDSDLQTVEQWLQSYGFKIEQVSQARNVIQFSGNFGQIQIAFHTSIHTFQVNAVQHYANVSNPQIPVALQSVIAGVGPLHDFRPVSHATPGPMGHYDPSTHSIKPDLTLFTSSGTPYLYADPADAATIYDTPNALLNRNYTGTTYDGTGVNIGIAGDSNITMQDVTNYRVAFLGETAATANTPTVVVDGADPLLTNDEVEALLDTEIAGGIAPKASVYLYIAANTDLQTGLFLAIFRALDDNVVSILNISFGECEANLGASGNQLMMEIMTQAAAQGISVTVSTGDAGSAACDNDDAETASNGLAVNGIASTPYNIAVGGTDYDALASSFSTYVADNNSGTPPYYGTALSYIPEFPWNDSTQTNTDIAANTPYTYDGRTDIVAGGGGASSCATSTGSSGSVTCESGYAKPPFQSLLTPADGVRDLPDVSFLAGNGLYGAVWVVCSDSVANGALETYTNCETTDGAFTSSTSFSGFGGTSAAAPTLAGILALVEQKTGSRLGQADYVLYQLANSKYSTVFHDVTQGDNSVVCTSGSPNCGSNGFLTGYDAGTGYDQASGLGSIDVTQLVNNWNTVGLTSTATAFTINGSTNGVSSIHGASLTFNVGVSPSTASGVVGIVDTANEIPGGPQNNGQTNIALSNGAGSTVYNGLPGGTYTVSAYYGGDTSDAASTSSSIPVTITPEASTTALALNVYSAAGSDPPIANLSNVPYGSYYYADVQIYGKAEGTATQGLATGSIGFTDNGSAITSGVPINSANQAFYETPTTGYPTVFSVGSHSIAATYVGDASYEPSSSTAIPFTVVQGATTVTVSPASGSINSLASDQVTVTVNTSSAGAYPTGTIVLTANGVILASVNGGFQVGGGGTGGGVAISTSMSIQGSVLTAGSNTIAATYSGDANYTGSSNSAIITVTEAGFALKNSGAITVAAGATSGNTSSITVTPSNGFLGVIDLSCAVTTSPSGASNLPTCSMPSTVNITGALSVSATLAVDTTLSTTTGSYAITVTGTDANTGKITATTTVAVTVTGGTTGAGSFALSNSGNINVSPGATSGNTATITVTPSNGFTGTVNLSCVVTTTIANPIDPPTCTIPASVAISGTTASTAELTVATTAAASAFHEPSSTPFNQAGGIALAGLLFLVMPVRVCRGAKLLGMVVLAISLAAVGCGSGSSGTTTGKSGTTAGAYTVTVTGVDAATGTIAANTAVSVVVN